MHFPAGFPGLPLYAHLFLLADGRVFFDGGRMDDELEVDPCVIDLTHEPVQTAVVGGMAGGAMRNQSASVLLPPAQDQRVMIIGGGPAGKPNKTDAIDDVDIVDFKAAIPRFVAAAPLNLPRLHLNAVLLPDRTVFVTGGSLKQEDQPLARLQPEIYDPAADTWTLMAASTVPRLYHSTALLLPDGRVVAAGGNPEGGAHVVWDQDPEEEMRLDVFSPPYLFKGARPAIASAPDQCTVPGTLFRSDRRDASNIRWVSLVRNGVTTHSFDTSQRLVDLPIASRTGSTISVSVPANRNLAPPGWYMLFLVSAAGNPVNRPMDSSVLSRRYALRMTHRRPFVLVGARDAARRRGRLPGHARDAPHRAPRSTATCWTSRCRSCIASTRTRSTPSRRSCSGISIASIATTASTARSRPCSGARRSPRPRARTPRPRRAAAHAGRSGACRSSSRRTPASRAR